MDGWSPFQRPSLDISLAKIHLVLLIVRGALGGQRSPSDPPTPPLNSLKCGKIKCVTELQIQDSPLHPHSFRTPPPRTHTLTHTQLLRDNRQAVSPR